MAEDGNVYKVIRVVATSTSSWEEAARVGVAEAVKTITSLKAAKITESDILIENGVVLHFRVKLEMSFQIDRLRRVGVENIQVRRYLIIASRTLASPALRELVEEKVVSGPSEFHVLVPEPPKTILVGDEMTGMVDVAALGYPEQRLLDLKEAEARLTDFKQALARLGGTITGEVGLSDPVTSARRVMERSSFDEIIVSTLPLGISRWLKLDLPSRLERAFSIPVTALVQEP
jgi:flavin-binding protein dodecin